MRRALALCMLAAFAAPASAAAHATLLRTAPPSGAVVARAPAAVVVTFDDVVRVGGGNAVVANATGASVLGGKPAAHGRVLTLPLRHRLPHGAYSVRWSIVSDDGHVEKGVLAFAVGTGAAPPQSVLTASTPLTWSDVLLRLLYYGGILAAGGLVLFGLAAARPLLPVLRRPLAHALFFALLTAFVGGGGMLDRAATGTRYALVLEGAVIVAAVAAAAAALAPARPRLLPVAQACALALLAAPTLQGHALDRNQPRPLSVPVDLAHVVAAAVWLGGLAALAFVLPRTAGATASRDRVVARFSRTALVAVGALALTGIGRALMELTAVQQVWSTSYGRSLIAKTALFVALVAIGWLNRMRLLRRFERLRRSVSAELVLLLAVVGVVAVLTELRPGRDAARVVSAPSTAATLPQPVRLPSLDGVVDARELGAYAVAVARTSDAAMLTLLGPDGNGVDGRRVTIDGHAAAGCGSGCYRAPAGAGPLHVVVDRRPLTFTVAAAAPPASRLLAAVTTRYRSLRSVVFRERLSSSPRDHIETMFVAVAPDRLRYRTANGPSAIVIGDRRWDSSAPGRRYVESAQTPLRPLQPYWRTPTNVHLVAPHELTFLDRSIPAWFRVTLRGTLPRVVHMTAAAHFMVDRYVRFDAPEDVSPPPSR